jgi:hypothetical protein
MDGAAPCRDVPIRILNRAYKQGVVCVKEGLWMYFAFGDMSYDDRD